MYKKITKCPNFTRLLSEKLSKYPNIIIFALKINKIPEFYIIFARKMTEFYTIIARKIFFPEFFGARAPPPPVAPSPTPMVIMILRYLDTQQTLNSGRTNDKLPSPSTRFSLVIFISRLTCSNAGTWDAFTSSAISRHYHHACNYQHHCHHF